MCKNVKKDDDDAMLKFITHASLKLNSIFILELSFLLRLTANVIRKYFP